MKIRVFVCVALVLLGGGLGFVRGEEVESVKVKIVSKGKTTAQEFQNACVQVRADKMRYDSNTKTVALKGSVGVTVIQTGFIPAHFTGSSGSVQAQHIEKQIDAGSSVEVDPDAPIRELVAQLEPDIEVVNYRIKWYFSVFQFQSSGTAVYDAKKGTIKEDIFQGDENGRGFYRRSYTGVTHSILRKFAKDYVTQFSGKNSGNTTPFDFQQICKYGCVKHDLR